MDAEVILELSREEAQELLDALSYHLRELDEELVRTDAFKLQHELAASMRRLEVVRARLDERLSGRVEQSVEGP